MPKALRFLGWPVLVGVLLALLIIQHNPELVGLPRQEVHVEQAPLLSRLQEGPVSYANAVSRAAPAVANLYTTKMVSKPSHPLFDDPMFRRFFGDNLPQQKRMESSLGSAVIMSAEGYLLTNNHVTAGADQIIVALRDGRETIAQLVGSDPETDLAVLKIDLKNLPAMTLGRSDGIRTGDVCLAIGNPFGVGQTVTNGIISALNRTETGISDSGSFIQTDAPINPGNSGGALVDMDGDLIGINTAIFSRTGSSTGVGFAVPATMVKRVVDSAVGGAKSVERAWLGVKGDTVSSDMARSLGLDRPQGLMVTDVYAGGPAARAGIEQGDVITAIDGAEVNDQGGLNFRVGTRSTNDTVAVTVLRDGRTQTLNARVSTLPGDADPGQGSVVGQGALAGLQGVALNPALADRLGGDPFTSGVVVTGLQRNSIPARIGLRPNDLVVQIDGRAVTTVAALGRAQRGSELTIVRNGRRLTGRLP